MHVTIHYKLSEQGRKASILAGGDGKAEQAVIVEHGTEHFAAALAQADVGHDGTATLRLFMWYDPKFDAPPPIEELLSVRPAQAAAKAAEEVAAALARH
ncbi:MAG: hypothetical protein KGI08_09225, partial [Thaumarchaeota archaeon]|nr:hypothetical protein [Nitrososphaerota archaeon]